MESSVAPGEAKAIAEEAYIYGYPLITSEMTRRIQTNVTKPEGTRGPMGQFINVRQYPTAAFRDVTAPNADTLYSLAWVDLAKEPWVFSYPNLNGRYALYPGLSLWTPVIEVPGSRTTGEQGQTFALTGPTWKGTLPAGMKEIKSPTRYMVIIGRTYSTGTPADYKAVHALQDGYKLVPLSSYGKPYTPSPGRVDPKIDMKTPTRGQVNAMSAQTYFQMMADLMKDNPPQPEDGPTVARMAEIGLVPGTAFDLGKLPPEAAKAVEGAPRAGWEKIAGHVESSGKDVNGWMVPLEVGRYGTDYLQRATIAAFGWGANLPQDAVYPYTEADDQGQPLTGVNAYVIHFESKDDLPPVNGFWSVTMYDDQFFFVENPLNRYTLSPRNKLRYNEDGSVDLVIQHGSPGKAKESNWLPAPAGKFILMLRMYWPKETPPSILDGTWSPPAVTKVHEKVHG